MYRLLAISLSLLSGFALTKSVHAASTLSEVRDRGHVLCGVSQGLPGFSDLDSNGVYYGLDVDFCRAVASAIFDNADAVQFIPLNASDRFDALTSKKIDVLARNTTWTLSRDAQFGEFVGVSYYDGQGFMVRRSLGIFSAQELDGSRVCVNTGTTTELNAVDYFKANRVAIKFVKFKNSDDAVDAYNTGKCDVFTTDRSGLAAQRGKLKDPEAHIVLPEIISKEPLGPVVRQNDSAWADINRWTLNCWINAEEMGVTRRNVNQKISSKVANIRRLIGVEGDAGMLLGLSKNWCYNVIANVGNYGESFARNVGPDTELKLKRGVNALWSNGGILYAPPIR